MNAPDLNEFYNLKPNEKKVVVKSGVKNVTTFTLNKEDHTVGNLLRVLAVAATHTKPAAQQQARALRGVPEPAPA